MRVSSVSRTRPRLLVLALVACLVVVGVTAGTAPAQKQADTLRVVIGAEQNVDPIVASRGGQWVWGTFLESLIKVDSKGRLLKTGIITNWTHPNPLTWRFTVRKGVKFTNGEAGDAYAVANSITLNKYTKGAILSTYFQNLNKVRAINPTTVVLTTLKPQFNLANQLGTVFLLPPKYYKQVGSAGFRAAPVGTGPFKVGSIAPGRSMTVVANPDYWGPKPKLSQITFTYSPDPAQRLALVQSGAVDVAIDLTPSQARAASAAKLQVLRVATTLKLVMFAFSKQSPLNNIKVRKAISMAIDRDTIVKGIFQGAYQADGGLLNVIPGQKAKNAVAFNPSAAKALVPAGTSLTLDYPTDRYVNTAEVAQAVAQMLENVGIKVKLVPEPYIAGVVKVLSGQMSGLWITGAVPNVPDANFLAQGFLTKDSITKNCIDRRFDTLTAAALTKPNEAAAQPLYDQMDKLAVKDLACYYPLYRPITYTAMSNNVKGFVFTPLNTIYFDTTRN
jgi:peptide/nickel transport system substrate-binding protein